MLQMKMAKIPVRAYGDIVNQGKLQGTISSGSASVGGILGSFDCQEGIFSETGVIKNEGDITANGTMVGGIGEIMLFRHPQSRFRSVSIQARLQVPIMLVDYLERQT